MGYDMYWATTWDDAVGEIALDDPGYFRLDIWGMPRVMRLMLILDIVDDPEDKGRLPYAAEYGLDYLPAVWDKNGERIRYEPGSAEDRWLRASAEVLYGDSGGAIPLYKLATNDGWLVTRSEIERSLERYDAKFPDLANQPRTLAVPCCQTLDYDGLQIEDVPWWGEWIDWLRQAALHGGFRVY